MSERYRVGPYELVPGERKLFDRGSPVTLGARAFDLLVNLVQQRGRVMMKDELMMRVWPGVIVEENNLTVQVSALRKVLGAQSVATVPGRGYQLTLEVTELDRLESEHAVLGGLVAGDDVDAPPPATDVVQCGAESS